MKLDPNGFSMRKQLVAIMATALREEAARMDRGDLPMVPGPEALRQFAETIERELAAKERAEILA
jgi:hypothetical protein